MAVFLQQALKFVFLKEFLAVFRHVHHDIRSAVLLVDFLQCELRRSVAAPLHGRSILIALRQNIHAVADHERAVESQSEVTDDRIGILLVLIQEVVGAGEGYLIDILVDFLGGHTNAAVADGDGASFCVHAHGDLQLAHLALEISLAGEGLQLLCCIHGVADNLADEDLMIRIEEFLDDRKNVLGRYTDITFLHDVFILIMCITLRLGGAQGGTPFSSLQKACQKMTVHFSRVHK